MKKLNKLYEEYSALIKIIGIVIPLIFALWKYIAVYIHIPDRMDAFEKRARIDSIAISHIIHRNDSTLDVHEKWAFQLGDSINSINRKLKNNFIQ